jgi:PadR family transcriptional regulator
MKVEGQVLKGHLDTLLLAALDGGPRHGYAIIEALREDSGGRFDLPTGTVYPALHRLQRAGLISGTWSVVDGRRRRTYQLTALGHDKLHTERATWRDFAATVTALLEPAPCPTTH